MHASYEASTCNIFIENLCKCDDISESELHEYRAFHWVSYVLFEETGQRGFQYTCIYIVTNFRFYIILVRGEQIHVARIFLIKDLCIFKVYDAII